MKTPEHNDLKRMYEAFTQDHDRLRQDAMASWGPVPQARGAHRWRGGVRELIGVTIMRSRITKLATAALVMTAIVLGIRAINGTTAWADVVRALGDVNDIHIVSGESEVWLKPGKKSRYEVRDEDGGYTFVDDGTRELRLWHRDKTAQFRESGPETDRQCDLLRALRGEDTHYFTKVEALGRTDDGLKVYEVRTSLPEERITAIEIVLVDPDSDLPVRTTRQVMNSKTGQVRARIEETYDYDPIPSELFELIVPPGYTDITYLQTEVLSGRVVDEYGKPVTGAQVLTSDGHVRARTNGRGLFFIRQPASQAIIRFPMLVRAVRPNDPHHVAWTLLRNPRHERQRYSHSDDDKRQLEQSSDVVIVLADGKTLRRFIPPDPGTPVFANPNDSHPSGVRDIVLKMQPANVVTGRITDREGRPVADALVSLGLMEIAVGENEIYVHRLGRTEEEENLLSLLNPEDAEEVRNRLAFALTDENGRYTLGHLPAVWHRTYLDAKADGYVNVGKTIFQDEGNDLRLTAADLTIRGTVVDDHGAPLVGREVEIDVESDEEDDFEIEEVFTDAEGRFELTGVPAVEGLKVQIAADEKPYDWGENELTHGRPFIYYLMLEQPVTLEPNKREYSITIVASRPDITLDIQVKDTEGRPLADVPVGVCSPRFYGRKWYISELVGKTDSQGRCRITKVPRIDPLQLWVGTPDPREFDDWEFMPELSEELKAAIRKCQSKHDLKVVTVQLEDGKKDYEVSIKM